MLLTSLKTNYTIHRVVVTFLFVFSFSVFHSQALADPKKEVAESYRDKGLKAYQAGKLDEALENYNKALSLEIESPDVYNDAGVLYEQIGATGKAEAYYLEAIRVDRKFLPAYSNLAYLYLAMGHEDLAAEYFKLRFEIADTNDSWTDKAKEELLKLKPSYSKWIQITEAKRLERQIEQQNRAKFEEDMRRSQEFARQGETFLEEEKYRKAIHEFDKALMLAPANPKIVEQRKKAVLALAEERVREGTDQAIKWLNSGDIESAKTEIQRLLSTIPDTSYKREQ